MIVKHSLLIGISIIIITVIGVIIVPVHASSEKVEAYVDDGFYSDLDGQGDLYDIQIDSSIYIQDFKWFYAIKGYDIKLQVGLEYPSGLEYTWDINLVVYSSYKHLTIVFEDATFESGLYTLHLFSKTGENSGIHLFYSQLVFDPPGGGTASRPGMCYY